MDWGFLNEFLGGQGISDPLVASLILAVGGAIVLGIAGKLVVDGAVGLAAKIGVSRLLIGLVVVAFGTSAPELIISMMAVFDGTPGIAVGNVVGSNIANILLILGIGAMISPIDFKVTSEKTVHSAERNRRNIIYRDGSIMLIATLLLIGMGRYCGSDMLANMCPGDNVISQNMGFILVGMLIVYILFSYVMERDGAVDGKDGGGAGSARLGRRLMSTTWELVVGKGFGGDLFWLAVGFAGLYFGADALITGAVDVAEAVDVPRPIIGVTMVAFGTSVPELVTVIIAARKKLPQVALGGIVGSNIFNILAVIGITALFRDVAIAESFVQVDFWVMLAAAVLMLAFLWGGGRVTRGQGALMVAAYVAYIVYLFYVNPPQVV